MGIAINLIYKNTHEFLAGFRGPSFRDARVLQNKHSDDDLNDWKALVYIVLTAFYLKLLTSFCLAKCRQGLIIKVPFSDKYDQSKITIAYSLQSHFAECSTTTKLIFSPHISATAR